MFIVYCYSQNIHKKVIEQFYPSVHVENLLDEIWKLMNLVSS